MIQKIVLRTVFGLQPEASLFQIIRIVIFFGRVRYRAGAHYSIPI